MIYSRFGTKLTLVSKQDDNNGQLSIQATAEGATEVREYHLGDLKADDGLTEINQAIAILPLKAAPKKPKRHR